MAKADFNSKGGQIFRYWGKAKPGIEQGASYHLLPFHCLDVTSVCKAYLQVKKTNMNRWAQAFGMEPETLLSWFLFFSCLHDLGKTGEGFQALNRLLRVALVGEEPKRNYHIRHDSLGFLVWNEYLWQPFAEKFFPDSSPAARRELKSWFSIWMQMANGHHGKPPQEGDRAKFILEDHFSAQDLQAGCDLFQLAIKLFQPDLAGLAVLAENDGMEEVVDAVKNSSWEIAGFFVLCDWLGSNQDVFKYQQGRDFPDDPLLELEAYWKNAQGLGREALKNSGMLPSQKAERGGLKMLFPEFSTSPSPLQSMVDTLEVPSGPNLWILEDATGSGKTEAAMILCSRIFQMDSAQGLFVGMPTMATANAMYERMAKCYGNLYEAGTTPSLVLTHGARHLSKAFRESIQVTHIDKEILYSKEDPTVKAQCAPWLADGTKKSLLADVGVGTLDQILLSVFPVRHQSLRAFGMSDKVLIVDEVHACDTYMACVLERVLELHARSGGSAILLSATLPLGMKKSFANSFRKGLDRDEPVEMGSKGYPLITRVNSEKKAKEISVDRLERLRREFNVVFVHTEADAQEYLLKAIRMGRCACWIRNTVSDAIQAYSSMKTLLGEDGHVLLFHSRVALKDRLEREKVVLDGFGKSSKQDMRAGKLLIATQVVEQSLDLDFDNLVSDLSPMDSLLQRAGRSRRHFRDAFGNPIQEKPGISDGRGAMELVVLAPPWEENPDRQWYKRLFSRGAYVYPNVPVLWRTQKILMDEGIVRVPEKMRDLIEPAIGNDQEEIPAGLEGVERDMCGAAFGIKSFAKGQLLNLEQGYSTGSHPQWYDEERFVTRLGEDQVTVYLAIRKQGRLAPLYAGENEWDYSALKVPWRFLDKLELMEEDEALVQELKELNPKFRREDWVFCLDENTRQVRLRSKEGAGGVISYGYDPTLGLVEAGNET